jgi:polysaccharide biosynthesis protein PslG
MRIPRKFSLGIAVLLMVISSLLPMVGLGAAPSASQAAVSSAPTEPYFFPETQHYVSGRFRQYWEDNGGLFVFGYPLTRTFMEKSTDGNSYLTQYFERARFEYHPTNSQPYDVLLTLVGNEVVENRRSEPPFLPVPNPNNGTPYFAETGHTLSGDFLLFWQQRGGLQNFGFPLSEPFPEVNSVDGKTYTVQYFERGRWEAHPEIADPTFRVLLGLMGKERMDRFPPPAFATAPETSPPTGSDIPGGTGGPYRANHIEYGFNTFLIGNFANINYNNRVLGKVREAGFGWIRIQLVWKDFEEVRGQYHWEILDSQVAAANANGVKVMISVVKAPHWANPTEGLPETPQALDAFYNLMREVSGRYAGRVKAYEIWNEQNLAGEVGGNVRIAPYYETLRNGFQGVRKNDPSAAVLFGGLTPTGVNDPSRAIDDVTYLRQFYAYNGGAGKQFYDHLAAHPGSAANAPDTRFPNGTGECGPTAEQRHGAADGTCWNSSPDFYFRRIEEQRAVMEQNGESGKQIWLTEFGWDACQGLPVPVNYEYCELTSEQQQAQYIVRAFEIGRNEWPWMGVMMLWNLNYQTIPGIPNSDEKYGWGVLRPDFSHRPAYDAIKNMPK